MPNLFEGYTAPLSQLIDGVTGSSGFTIPDFSNLNTATASVPTIPSSSYSVNPGSGTPQQTSPQDLTALTNLVNSLNVGAQQTANAARIPGGAALEQQSSNMIGQELKGVLPQDVSNQIAQAAAERGMGTGNSNLLQQLGLNSLQIQQQGQQNLTAADARNPGAPLFDPTTQLLTPYQQGELTNQSASIANQGNYQKAQLAAQSAYQQGELNLQQAQQANQAAYQKAQLELQSAVDRGQLSMQQAQLQLEQLKAQNDQFNRSIQSQGGGMSPSRPASDPFSASSNWAAGSNAQGQSGMSSVSDIIQRIMRGGSVTGNTVGSGPTGNGLTTTYVPGSGTLVNYNLPNDWFTGTGGGSSYLDTTTGYSDTGYNPSTNQNTYDPFSGYLDYTGSGGGGSGYSDTSYNSGTDQSYYDPFSGYLDYTGG